MALNCKRVKLQVVVTVVNNTNVVVPRELKQLSCKHNVSYRSVGYRYSNTKDFLFLPVSLVGLLMIEHVFVTWTGQQLLSRLLGS